MGSRLKNTIKNSAWGVMYNLVATLLNFITRTIFITKLGNEYLGINGLFTNILFILSFAELGIGHAITYAMYKPAAEGDKEKIKSLLKLYKDFYNKVGLIIFITGILLIPFIPYLIKGDINIKESLILIYLLYLFETASSYFLSYKSSIISVNQKDYICDRVKIVTSIVKTILQILSLIIFKSYIIYLVIYVLSTFISNSIIYLKASKDYPFINEKDVKALDPKLRRDIINNIKSLVLYKIGRVSLSGTDNIIISSIIGITFVGLYSNYSLIISSVSGIAYIILKGCISSVGNVNATESLEKKEKVMKQLLFVSSYIYGFICICLSILLTPFINIWIGSEYNISFFAVLAAVFYILIDGMEFSSHTYISTLGYFNETKYSSLICALLNIVLSIILGLKYGLFGVFISTSISKILTSSWYDTYIVYKKEFKKSPKSYYKEHLYYLLITSINYIICLFITNFINNNSILGFILKTLIVILLSNFIYILNYYQKDEFKTFKKKLLR